MKAKDIPVKEPTLQEKIELEWCELNYTKQVREKVEEYFPDYTEKDIEILTQVMINGFTPITNIVGAVAARLYTLPTDAQRASILDHIVRLAEADELNIIVNNIVYVSPEYQLKDIQMSKRHFIPPLVMKPKTVRRNEDTGYHINTTGSLILGHPINHHSGNISLDVINTQNAVGWRINQWVLDTQDDIKPEGYDQEDWDQFQYEKSMIINLIGLSRKFYLTHKVDKRGRLGSHGYHINYQGNEFSRALVDFGTSEIIKGYSL